MSSITMPRLSDSMEEGTILSWLKDDGEHVEPGEDLVEIETDKATVTQPAERSGTLTIIVREGTTVPVGAPIAELGPNPAANSPAGGPAPPVEAEPAAGVAPDPAPSSIHPTVVRSVAVRTTPLARRFADVHGVALAEVPGSGPHGRVTRADVAAKAGIAPASDRPQPAPSEPARTASAGTGDAQGVKLSRLQQVIARRMADAATIPAFQVETEASMDAAVALRARLKAAGGGVGPTLNDIVVKAAATALRTHPRANGSYRDGHFELHARVNIGIAVVAQDALVVPTIMDADTRSLSSIAAETRRLAERVRSAEITPRELADGTFTVSNLGMYGITAMAPVINPPQAAILGVGVMRVVLARVDGEIVERQQLTLTLTCDHRILYGADAARFLASIKASLEQPLSLAL